MKQIPEKSIPVLEKIARVSKMDCWFQIRNGKVFDLENNKYISSRRGVFDLVDGMSEEDFSYLNEEEKYRLMNTLIKL